MKTTITENVNGTIYNPTEFIANEDMDCTIVEIVAQAEITYEGMKSAEIIANDRSVRIEIDIDEMAAESQQSVDEFTARLTGENNVELDYDDRKVSFMLGFAKKK